MVIGDDGVGLMVVDDGICAFCAKSRVIRAIFSFVLVTTVVVTSATPVLSVKDFVIRRHRVFGTSSILWASSDSLDGGGLRDIGADACVICSS